MVHPKYPKAELAKTLIMDILGPYRMSTADYLADFHDKTSISEKLKFVIVH